MKTVWVDFNASDRNGMIMLSTRGSLESLKTENIIPGDRVLLSDNDVRVPAKIIQADSGLLLADPDWTKLEFIDSRLENNDEDTLA